MRVRQTGKPIKAGASGIGPPAAPGPRDRPGALILALPATGPAMLPGGDLRYRQRSCIGRQPAMPVAKDTSISVFASRPGQTRKVLLFKFGPAYADLMPVISSVDQHTVQITIREISDLIFRREKFSDLSISYKIDVIDYPSSNAEKHE
jgi:hypothetical protein